MTKEIQEVKMLTLDSENNIVSEVIFVTDLEDAIKHLGCWEREYFQAHFDEENEKDNSVDFWESERYNDYSFWKRS